MIKQVLLAAFILVSFMSAYSQDNNLGDIEKLKKGNQIVTNARKAIGVEKEAVNAFHLKSKSSTTTKIKTSSDISLPDVITEINATVPDKIQYIWAIEGPIPSKLTSVWNGAKYKKLSEIDMLGTRTVKDVTNRDNKEVLKNVAGKIGNGKLEKLQKAGETNPKEDFNNKVWQYLFPLILIHPFEQNLEFKYVGRAESLNRVANVVDVKSKNGRNYRLLFDSETNYLMMMILSYKGFDGDYEGRYYFSNRESADKVLIPKTIKVENKFTPTGEAQRISYTTIDVIEFSLQPEFKSNFFDVN